MRRHIISKRVGPAFIFFFTYSQYKTAPVDPIASVLRLIIASRDFE